MDLTLTKAADAFRTSREIIRRGLAANGVKKKERYTIYEIHVALSGDWKAARARQATADAALKESELAEKEGTLISMAEVESLYTEALLPVRQRLTAMPSECCTRANPTDPQHARASLQQWVDEALPLIRKQLPKPKK